MLSLNGLYPKFWPKLKKSRLTVLSGWKNTLLIVALIFMQKKQKNILKAFLESIFISYASADRDIEEVLHRFYKDIRESDLLSFCWDMEELQAYRAEREIKTGHGTIIVLDDFLATSTSLLREEVIKPKEEEPKKQGVEIVGLQAMGKIKDGLQKVISSPDIPYEEKVEIINEAASHVVDVFEARLKGTTFEETPQQKTQTLQQKRGDVFLHRPKQEKAVQTPDLSEIPLWQGRRLDGRPLDFIKTHYGQYLSAFGAEQNSVFQDQIRAHDPKLVQGVINQLREEGKGRKVGDFVKTRSARVDRELENIDPEYLSKAHREVHRLKVAARRRDPKS
jgi:hypothetical protein